MRKHGFFIHDSLVFNPSRPNPGRREKIKFLFSHFFVVPQKAFIKPSDAPQRSEKTKT